MNLSEKNLTFRGGTCIIKACLDYYRFSEDLDFTWGSDVLWRDESTSESVRLCSAEMTTLIEHLKVFADRLDMNFSGDKANGSDVHISSGGRMVDFHIDYYPDILISQAGSRLRLIVETMKFPLREINCVVMKKA